jgi:hypothetical protein
LCATDCLAAAVKNCSYEQYIQLRSVEVRLETSVEYITHHHTPPQRRPNIQLVQLAANLIAISSLDTSWLPPSLLRTVCLKGIQNSRGDGLSASHSFCGRVPFLNNSNKPFPVSKERNLCEVKIPTRVRVNGKWANGNRQSRLRISSRRSCTTWSNNAKKCHGYPAWVCTMPLLQNLSLDVPLTSAALCVETPKSKKQMPPSIPP